MKHVLLLASLLIAVFASAEPLVLTPETTAILDRSTYAGRHLQYYLLRAVAKAPDAADYALGAKPADRSAPTAFPLYTKADDIPAGRQVIVVGPHDRLQAYLSDEDYARLDAARGSILLRRTGVRVVVAIHGDPWAFAHVRTFLDKIAGVRMYAPHEEDLWLSMPDSAELEIGELNHFQAPYFAKTTFSSMAHERNREWVRFNSILSAGLNLRASHTIINYFKPDTYYDQHPEIYPMKKDGSRPRPIGDAWNPCLGNPELLTRIAMGEIRERMNSERPPTYFSLGVMDCEFDCHCPVCSRSSEALNGSYSNLYYTFMNQLAREVAEAYPELYLTTYLYSNVGSPPTGMRIEPNIVVDVVTKSYRFSTEEGRRGTEQEILQMAGLGASWITHDWNFSGVTPRLYSRQWASFLQWAATHGMKGIYTEWSPGEAWYLDGCKYWVQWQLLSDPYQDVDQLWRQYCTDMYGAGSEAMYRFYSLFAQKHMYAHKYYSMDDLPRREMVGFTADDLAWQRRLLEEAVALTSDHPRIQRRLEFVQRYFRGHELFATATGVPGRAYHRYTVTEGQTGINKAALDFYLNDDGSQLLEAVRYYENERTIPPDSHSVNKFLGADLSYRANYSRALGTILQAVREEALSGTDLPSMTVERFSQVTGKARQVMRDHYPDDYLPKRARELEALATKMLWIPRVDQLPTFDGKLDDPVWQEAAELTDFTLADLILPTTEGNETRGAIMRVGDLLVIGLHCQQPNGVWAETPREVETGTRIWRESCAEFFYGPQPAPGEEPVYFQYIVNSLGAFRGFQVAKDNRLDVQRGVSLADDGTSFTIEVALPLKVEGQYDFSQARVGNFTIMRQVYYKNTFSPPERLGWHPMFFTAHNAESRGLVFLEP